MPLHGPKTEPTQRGEQRSIGPIQASLGFVRRHRDLVAQHKEFRVLRHRGSSQQRQPTRQADDDQAHEMQEHGTRSWQPSRDRCGPDYWHLTPVKYSIPFLVASVSYLAGSAAQKMTRRRS